MSDIDPYSLEIAVGDDSPPTMKYAPERQGSSWGSMTSQPRTASSAFLAFVEKHKATRLAREEEKNG